VTAKGVSFQTRAEFAGVGTRVAKIRLNKLAKTDPYARALRTALEIEDVNLTAKKYHGGSIGGLSYDQLNYAKKAEGIDTLVGFARAKGWTWGVQETVGQTTHIIYFEFPGVGQISWHYSPEVPGTLPTYPGAWDHQVNSTLRKLETAIHKVIVKENHD
jgi:hypothetical protein